MSRTRDHHYIPSCKKMIITVISRGKGRGTITVIMSLITVIIPKKKGGEMK